MGVGLLARRRIGWYTEITFRVTKKCGVQGPLLHSFGPSV